MLRPTPPSLLNNRSFISILPFSKTWRTCSSGHPKQGKTATTEAFSFSSKVIEHFLRRLQRRVADGSVTADQIAIYFSHREGANSYMTPLELDQFGAIHNWPKDFFGDQMMDVAETQKAAIKRRRETT